MRRRLTGLLAAAGLAGIIIGLPLLLIATHNVAAPRLGWTWDGIWRALLAPDDGTLLVTIVKIVGWISWAILTTTIGLEITSRARHLPVPQLRGLAWPQLLARGLVSAILAGFIATNTLNSTTEPVAAHPSRASAAPLVATAPLQAPAETPKAADTYTVKRGDTLSEIALDELGDGHAYPRIFKASKATLQPDGRKLTDPDLIIPGWKLTIPNTHTDPEKPDTKPDRHRRDEDSPAKPPRPASPGPTAATTTPTAPATPTLATPSVAGSDRVDPAPVLDDEVDDGWVDPPWLVAGLAGAGSLLAGALWLMLQRRRRAQFRARRPGRTIPVPAAGFAPIEKTLAHAGAPTSEIIIAIDEGLRRLAASLHTSGQPIPTLTWLKVTTDTLTARFADPVTLPDPWQPADSTEVTAWRVERRRLDHAEPPDPDSPPPWPQLATIGMDDQDTWHLLNLEALGVITLAGDPDYATDLARYLAGELAVVPWARDLRIDCVGVCPELAALNPARVHHHETGVVADTVAAAVKVHDRLTAASIDHLEDARLAQADDRLWDSRILITTPEAADLPVLTDLITKQPGRTATSVLIVGSSETIPGTQIRVDADGRVRVPSLGLDLIANGLTPSEATGCAAVLAAGDILDDIPTPVPQDTGQAWEELCDEAGQLRPEHTLPRDAAADADAGGDASSLLPGDDEHWVTTTANTAEDLAVIAPRVPAEVRLKAETADPTLDKDLAAWAASTCDRPRLSVLGPMRLRVGPGGDPTVVAKRIPYYTNMVAYLAATRGATADQVANAMGLGTRRVHKDMSVVRDWLGTNPRTGDHYLPDAAHNKEAQLRGVGIYIVEDLIEDADLFRRLRLRGEARGANGLPDLLAALRLVVGAPYEDQRRKARPWLTDTRPDHHLQCAIVDVAHLVTSIALEADDTRQARAAAELAMLAAPDQHTPALDLATVAAKQGRDDEAEALARSVIDWTDGSGEPPIELPERADRILRTHRWLEPKERAS